MQEKQTPEVSSFRVPIMLSVSKTPLYLRIDCPAAFPTSRPYIIVLARVYHPTVHNTTKVISVPQLDNWNLQNGSNLLSVLRDIHSRFDAEPPMPEKMAKQAPQ